MLNRALRLSDGEIIIKMGFFISNLHRKQFIDTKADRIFVVYRGRGMSKDEFQ